MEDSHGRDTDKQAPPTETKVSSDSALTAVDICLTGAFWEIQSKITHDELFKTQAQETIFGPHISF